LEGGGAPAVALPEAAPFLAVLAGAGLPELLEALLGAGGSAARAAEPLGTPASFDAEPFGTLVCLDALLFEGRTCFCSTCSSWSPSS